VSYDGFNYDYVIQNLAQGGWGDPGVEAGIQNAWQEFDVIVLCAEEHQGPRVKAPAGKYLFRLPLDDDPYVQLPTDVGKVVVDVASAVGTYLLNGHRVVTTCHQGLNRSGLTTAIILMKYYRMSAQEAAKLIRSRRDRDALCNPMFVQFLERLSF
jgi:hypothetical protein